MRRLAHGLVAHGIGPGDVVILQLPNWAPFLTFHIALTAIGAVTALVPFVYREHEISGVAALTGACALVVPDEYRGFSYRRMAERVRTTHIDLRHVFLVGPERRSQGHDESRDEEPDGSDAFVDYAVFMAEPWERTAPCDLAARAPELEDLTAIGFTSGTTGDLKGVMFDTRIIAAVNRGFVDRYGLNENDRILGGSPLGHAVGFTHALRMALTIGGSIVMQQRWEPGEAIELIRRERCTYMAAATPFLMDVIGHPALAEAGHLPSLRLFLCGGASIPEQLARDAGEALPHTFTSPLWGMTECGGVTTCPFDAPAEKRHTTDGKPCGGMELKVVDRVGHGGPARRGGRADGARSHGGPGLLRARRSDPRILPARRVVPHRRSGADGRRRLHQDHRPHQGPHHPRRGEHRAGGDRERAVLASQGRERRGGGHARPAARGAHLRLRDPGCRRGWETRPSRSEKSRPGCRRPGSRNPSGRSGSRSWIRSP